MEKAELKRKMIGLWKDTFHDSDAYVRLIFDTYFNPELIEYEESGSELVSALMGIPYEFGGSVENRIRGLYLCGLATKSKMRGQGLMTSMLERINDKAREAGFAFTFLIPATGHLRDWYARRGYVDAFRRSPLNYTAVHDFQLENDTLLAEQKGKVAELKRRYYDSLKCEKFDNDSPDDIKKRIISIIKAEEEQQQDMELIHSEKDIEAILAESIISNEPVYFTYTPQGDITAVGFVGAGGISRMDVKRLYSADVSSEYKLLDHIKRQFPDFALRVYVAPRKSERKQLAEVYGMARILNLYDILKFQTKSHGDLKYSILVKAGNLQGDETIRYTAKGGKVKEQILDSGKKLPGEENSLTEISLMDMSNVLFRRPDTGVLITEAFGMPSLGGYISLMLD